MDDIRFCVCRCQSENSFVCFGANPPQRACARDLPRDGRTREGRSERRQKKTVCRREQERTVGMRGQSREGHSHESGTKETSQQKSERRLLGPVDLQMQGWLMRESKSALLVALSEFSLGYTLALAHRMHKKCHRLPSVALGANPRPCFSFCSFLPASRLCCVNP